ncbi:MAG: hypothetical protein HY303_17280 [Candidatus Wallbacteria bacterium]|nr:hypothetical protein [Candidatus Wallbacteria bacterium]
MALALLATACAVATDPDAAAHTRPAMAMVFKLGGPSTAGARSAGASALATAAIAKIQVDVFAGLNRATGTSFSHTLAAVRPRDVQELVLTGVRAGRHMLAVSVLDSVGGLLGTTDCVFDFTPGVTTVVNVQGVAAGLFLSDANGVCTHAPNAAGSRHAADLVIGQADFVSGQTNRGGAASASTLATPNAVASDGTRLAVADTGNNRVLLYRSVNDTVATTVVGQADATLVTSGTSRSQFFRPIGITFSGKRLIVADTGNQRVVIYNDVTVLPAAGAAADIILVGPITPTAGPGITPTVPLSSPTDVAVSGSTLAVADSGNNRVLLWDNLPGLFEGKLPDRVLGQVDITSTAPNRGATTGAATFVTPHGVAIFNDRLAVADSSNNRVLIFNGLSRKLTGASADLAIGQRDFVSGAPRGGSTTTNGSGFHSPRFVTFGLDRLFVSENTSDRVLIFQGLSSLATGQAASDVLGQPNFTSGNSNNGLNGTRDAFALRNPRKVTTAGTDVFVADEGNSRVLGYPF